LTGRSTPVYAGRYFLTINHLTTLVTLDFNFIREDLDFITAVGAFV
jgi:hypothetical protein